MKFGKPNVGLTTALVPALVLFAVSAASATSNAPVGGNAALPWETALGTLANALTGNTAKIISIIAIFIAGVALIFGEDLGQFARRLLMIVIAAAFLLGAGSFLGSFVTGGHI